MKNIFDSKFVYYADKFADLVVLNIITILCCIPIITIGPALTAMHYVLLRMLRNEENYITKMFFKSFKENFRQGVALWIIYLLVFFCVAADFYLVVYKVVEVPGWFIYLITVVATIALASSIWTFILLSRYHNTVRKTLKFSLALVFGRPMYSFIMTLLFVIPFAGMYFFSIFVSIVLFGGFTLPGVLQSILYSRVFDKLEGIDGARVKQEDKDQELSEKM